MNYKKKYKQDVLNELTPNDKFNEITAKLNFKPQKGNNIMKKGLVIASTAVCLTLVIGVGTYFIVKGNQTPEVLSANSVVKMNLNPSITLMVDDENKVVSVTGENNEGKMIIVGEEIKGKTLEEAIEIILSIENETGYLVSGNATLEDNNLSISVTVDDEKIQKNMQDRISKTVESVCTELNVNQTLTYESLSLEDLKTELSTYDSSYTSEELSTMNFEDVYSSLKTNYQQTAVMCSEELIELYNTSKEYEFQIAESDFTIQMIKDLKPVQASMLETVFSMYDLAMEQLENGIGALNDARYNYFVNEESVYQKANSQLLTLKAEVIKHKNDLANNTQLSEEDKQKLQTALDNQIEALETATTNLSKAKEDAEKIISELETTLVSLMDKVTDVKDNLVSLLGIDLEQELTKKATELDTYLNETKTAFFTDFETKYAEDIAKAEQELLAYKEALKSQKA